MICDRSTRVLCVAALFCCCGDVLSSTPQMQQALPMQHGVEMAAPPWALQSGMSPTQMIPGVAKAWYAQLVFLAWALF